jgi:hypothetical protein
MLTYSTSNRKRKGIVASQYLMMITLSAIFTYGIMTQIGESSDQQTKDFVDVQRSYSPRHFYNGGPPPVYSFRMRPLENKLVQPEPIQVVSPIPQIQPVNLPVNN